MRLVLLVSLLVSVTARAASVSSVRLRSSERVENRFTTEDTEDTEGKKLCLGVLCGESSPTTDDRKEPDPLHGGAVYVTTGQSNETWHGQAKVTGLNIELVTARSPRTDIGFVLTPMTFDQPKSWFGDDYGDGNENVRAIAGSLLLRRWFNRDSSRLHVYGEAGTGPMYAEKSVPASTSRFNFVSQLGVGVVLMPRSRYPIVAGYRFQHVSNGGYAPRNPGLNFSSLILGIRFHN